jgi:hypothetical protein
MNDYTWPSVYFAYFFFAICLALAIYFCLRSRKDGYWSKQGEQIKYQVFEDEFPGPPNVHQEQPHDTR